MSQEDALALELDSHMASIHVSRQEQTQALRSNINWLAAMLLGEDFLFEFPAYYSVLFKTIAETSSKQRDFSKLALGLPRGFAKTTFIKLNIIWLILFSPKRFFLIVCASEALAQKFLADIRDFLDNPQLIILFGNWRDTATKVTQSDLEFSLMGRKIVVAALGAGSSVRGITRNNSRPDVIIMDDIQKKEDSASDKQSDDLLTWMLATLMKVKSPFGCLYLFLANMYPTPNSLLRKLKANPEWLSFVIGGLLEDGTSLWEDLHPATELRSQLREAISFGKPEIFLSEILNDTQSIAFMKFDSSRMLMRPQAVGSYSHEGNFIIIDPSGSKTTSDSAAMGYFEVINGKSYLCELETGRWTPKQQIEAALAMAVRNNCSLVCPEAIAYQASLLYWLRETAAHYGLTGISVEPLTRNTSKNKAIRSTILRLQPSEKGEPELGVADKTKNLVLNQLYEFNPLITTNTDDILDVLAYEQQVRTKYDHLIVVPQFDLRAKSMYNETLAPMADEDETSAI